MCEGRTAIVVYLLALISVGVMGCGGSGTRPAGDDTGPDTDTDTDTETETETETEDPNAPVWVAIEGGSFTMGHESFEESMPLHDVSIPGFEILATEVTVAQYLACVDQAECSEPDDGYKCNWGEAERDQHPVNCVTWQQAVQYCEWVEGRLPTESEWEYAARNQGEEPNHPWGDEEASCTWAIVSDSDGGGTGCGEGITWPVCSRMEGNTDQGLCDMCGNVFEWMEDRWHENYEGAPADGTAWLVGATGPDERVARGCSYTHPGVCATSTFRDWYYEITADSPVGFRCARSVE